MTRNQYRAALMDLGMTQADAADFLRVSRKTANTYANGGTIPHATALLLQLMVKLNLKPEDLE